MVEANMGIKDEKGKKIMIPAHETHLVHAVIESVTFHQKTGKKTSKPMLQTFYLNDFLKMAGLDPKEKKPRNFFGDKTVKIAHDPRQTKAQTRKPELEEMSEEQLREEFKKEFGNEASDDETSSTLIRLIKDNRS